LLLGDFNGWNPDRAVKLHKVKKGLWAAQVSLPEDAYIEYAYRLDGEHCLDPGNPRRVFNGIHKFNNYFYMPQAAPTPLARRRSNLPRGTISEHSLPTPPGMAQRGVAPSLHFRKLTLYQPPVDQPCPLLVVYDGQEYLRYGRILNILDNLIQQRVIRPVALALLANGGPLRYLEYDCSDATLEIIQGNLLPLARQHLNLVDPAANPGAYGVMGASMGGLMAVYTAFRMPQVFGKVLSQSGAFFERQVLARPPESFERSVLLDLVRLQERLPLDIWMDVGRLEWLLEANRSFYRLLVARGYDPAYREYSGGHNYTAWRDDSWRGLIHLFGTGS
jgi:enterochelin esterase family protein